VAARATYTDADKAKVYVVLTTNEGNVKRTARETGVPENTVRRWKKDFEENGPPSTEEVEREVTNFLEEAVSVRDLSLQALRLKVELLLKDPDKVKVAELTTLMGVLTDKIDRAAGLALGRVEHQHTLPPVEEMAAQLGSALRLAIEAADRRDVEIIDAEFEEQAPKALPSP
jgi:transposase-like protein